MSTDRPVAIVTGAAQGIGLRTAERLASEGAFVLLIDNNEAELTRSTNRLQREGLPVECAALDVRDVDGVRAAVSQLAAREGRIDWLVNNAGVAVFEDPRELDAEGWRRCMEIDLDGVWHFCQAAFPHLSRSTIGSIVNVASVHSHKIIKGTFPYPVAKHAVLGLTRSLAVEYAGDQVRVNAVCPGYVDTPLTRGYFESLEDPQGERDRMSALHPLGRIATEDDIAQAIGFLLSPASSYITGISLVVDGGRSLVYHD